MSDELIKIVLIIVVSAVFITLLRNKLGENAFVLAVAVTAVVMLTVLDNLFIAILKLQSLFNKSGDFGQYFTVALKALGISYITAFAADLCRDFGLSALAQTAEIAGKIVIFVLSLPLMTAVMSSVLKFARL